ncbi:MAG: alpha-(1-_6)-mannopyranosyltransferase A [Nocardiaceae bacterium]|nr:alpha-(1->6)-mannopyranosyltransferase A [Nocardiaceae bacterium]
MSQPVAESRIASVRDRLREFLPTDAGRAAVLGFYASLLITFGGLGAGAVRRDDPLLEMAQLSWLRFGHGLWLSRVVCIIGVGLMIMAWMRLGRETMAGRARLNDLRFVVVAWTAPLLLSVPLFSRDAYSYLAQGALLRDGFDPYAVGPVANPGILLENVSSVWTATTCPYGPLFLLIGDGITTITGDNVVAGTMMFRLAMLPGLALMMWAIPHIATHLGGKPPVALWLAVLNPLVLIHLIGGVHNELLMVGLMAAGIALALERHHGAGIAVVTVGAAIKATAGIALPFIIWIWMIHERQDREAEGRKPLQPFAMFVKNSALGGLIFLVVFVGLSLVAGVGIGWLTALSGSAKIINWLSLPTILAHIVTWFTPLDLSSVLAVTRSLCALALAGILVWSWWRYRRTEAEAVMGILVAFVAIVVLSPAALPWYYSWPLALAAGFSLKRSTMAMLTGLCAWLMLIFLPDGNTGLYNLVHVLVVTFVAILAGWSLVKPDPMRIRTAERYLAEHVDA